MLVIGVAHGEEKGTTEFSEEQEGNGAHTIAIICSLRIKIFRNGTFVWEMLFCYTATITTLYSSHINCCKNIRNGSDTLIMTHNEQRHSSIQEGAIALFTGTLYGAVHTLTGHPLDTIKSKMQLQVKC